jgi:Family of unknown function (DUF5317)
VGTGTVSNAYRRSGPWQGAHFVRQRLARLLPVGLASLILVLALLVGRIAGGRVSELGQLRMQDGWLLVAALLTQVLGSLASNVYRPAYGAGLVVSAVLATGFAYRNRRLSGVPLAVLGLLLNALVVALNGAMPVSLHSAARAGVPSQELAFAADPRHEPMGPQTRLAFLGAFVPVPLPVHREVDSPGDVLLAAGIGLLVVTGMSKGSPGRRGYYHAPARDESPVQ